MKPLSLVIDGVNSFYDRQEIDLRFDGLFCICGDTGSGKTTILDCIIIALFGSCNRASLLSDYVNLRRDKAEIRFTFEAEHGGRRDVFEVTRIISKTSGSKAKLINLTQGEVIAEQTTAVNAALSEIVGLSVEDFTQTVILEQGKFAKFLTAKKGERNVTVGNLFKLGKYKELGSKFKAKVNEFKTIIDNVNERLDELKDVTLAAIDENRKEVNRNKKREKELELLEAELSKEVATQDEIKRIFDKCVEAEKNLAVEQNKLNESSAALSRANEEEIKAKKELEEAESKLKEAENAKNAISTVESLLRQLEKRQQNRNDLIEKWKTLSSEEANLKDEKEKLVELERNKRVLLDENLKAIFDVTNFGEKGEYFDVFDLKQRIDDLKKEYESRLRSLADLQKKADEANEKRAKQMEKTLENERKISQAFATVESLKKEVERQKFLQEERRRSQAAAFIRSGLSDGDVCPVCGGTLHKKRDESVDELGDELKSVEEEYQNALDVYNGLLSVKQTSVVMYDEYQKNAALLNAELERAKAELSKIGETLKVPDKIDELQKYAMAAYKLDKELKDLQTEIKLTAQKYETAQKNADDVKRQGVAERVEADKLSEEINQKGISDLLSLKATAARYDEYAAKVENANKKLELKRKEHLSLIASTAAASESVQKLKEQVALKPPFDAQKAEKKSDELSRAKKEKETLIAFIARAEKEIEVAEQNLSKKRELEKERTESKRLYDVYSDIYKLVSGDKFVEYVAEEYVLQFTASASLVLSDLTGGKYTLEYEDGTFWIRDFCFDGMRRKASTLSGGETFLASLSLAIAISREIARYKSYEFFFLDEGFGTLDSQSIDTVIDALTVLSADTLVGVVTHRSELTDRIFDKLVVTSAGAGGGSRVQRAD